MVVVVGNIDGPPKCLVGVYHQLLALQWHIQGEARSRLDCSGVFMRLPHGLRDACMNRLRLSTFNGYGSRVIDILTGIVRHIGWCIVGRQAIWREGMLVLHKMRVAHTSQLFAYHI